MRRLFVLAFALALPLSAAGCDFYFGGGDDDDDPCLYPPEPGGAPLELRNPETGMCEYWGGGDDYCDPACGPCPLYDIAPSPSWGYCESQCSGLDEATCLDTAGCRGGYIDSCPPNADCDLEGGISFYECWAVDQTGPVNGIDCWDLDAWTCSTSDECRAVHENPCLLNDGSTSCLGNFSFCAPEPERQDPGTCYGEVLCDSLPPDCPVDSLPGIKDGCWTGFCIPATDCGPPPACQNLGENECVTRDDCDALYEGIDCTCDDTGCDCADWLFDSCEPAAP
jgi:hypothetical protein